MTEAQRALDEIERVLKLLTADLEDDAWSEFGKNKQIRYATNLKLGDLRRGHRALSLLPTLRAALTPPTTPSPPAWLMDLDEASAALPEMVALRKENERLREALEEVVLSRSFANKSSCHQADIARAALNQEPGHD